MTFLMPSWSGLHRLSIKYFLQVLKGKNSMCPSRIGPQCVSDIMLKSHGSS